MMAMQQPEPAEQRIGDYLVHPLADIFPLLEGEAFDALVADIRANGLREPILLDGQGRVLDGRNRFRACRELGIEPTVTVWQEREGDCALAVVISLNIKRRHLDAGQVTGLTLKLLEMKPEIRARAAAREKSGKPAPELEQGRAVEQACAITGASKSYVYELQALVADDGAALDEVITGAVTIPELKAKRKAETKARVAERIRNEPMPLPEGPFRVIVVDPPWPYASRADDITHRARSPYPDMTLEEICRLPVAARAHADCILWLWTTNAFLREAFTVLDAWGFEQKTKLTWVKNQMGTGDWLRGQAEDCLFAIKGRPLVTLTNQTTVLHAPRGEHSAKPDEFYTLVASLCPGSKLELFARQKREGWETWGAEA